jgi:hypothetical protein
MHSLVAVLCGLALLLGRSEAAYRHVLAPHTIIMTDEHNAMCPSIFMPTGESSPGAKLGCCLVDKLLTAVEVAFDAQVCGKSFLRGQYKGVQNDIKQHCNGEAVGGRGYLFAGTNRTAMLHREWIRCGSSCHCAVTSTTAPTATPQ